MYEKPYPLYHKEYTKAKDNSKVKLIRVCQDCGYIETQHGPSKTDRWKHLFVHPDYLFTGADTDSKQM